MINPLLDFKNMEIDQIYVKIKQIGKVENCLGVILLREQRRGVES